MRPFPQTERSHARRNLHVARKNRVGRCDAELQQRTFRCAIPDPRNLYRHRADPGRDLPLGEMAMSDQPPAASHIGLIGMGCEKHVQLRLDRLSDEIPGALAQQFRQRVGRKSFWRAKRDNRILRHVPYHFLCQNCGA